MDESSKKSKDASSKTTDKDSGQQLEEGPILKHDHSYIRHWLYDYVSEHIKVSARRIKIQLLSPCLYGTFSLDDKVNCVYVRVCICIGYSRVYCLLNAPWCCMCVGGLACTVYIEIPQGMGCVNM